MKTAPLAKRVDHIMPAIPAQMASFIPGLGEGVNDGRPIFFGKDLWTWFPRWRGCLVGREDVAAGRTFDFLADFLKSFVTSAPDPQRNPATAGTPTFRARLGSVSRHTIHPRLRPRRRPPFFHRSFRDPLHPRGGASPRSFLHPPASPTVRRDGA